MKSLMIALVLAAGAMPVSAAESAKPWTEADYAERKAMGPRWADPMREALHASVALDLSDPAGACKSAKEAEAYVEVGKKDMAALEARLRAEGKDLTPMTAGKAMMAEVATLARQRVDNACRGRSTSATPEQRADDDRIIGYGQAYVAAQKVAGDALAAKDRETACAKTAESIAVAGELNAFLASLKVKYRSNAGMMVQLNKISATTDGWGAEAAERVPGCPAAGG